jgi:hypothetical protein
VQHTLVRFTARHGVEEGRSLVCGVTVGPFTEGVAHEDTHISVVESGGPDDGDAGYGCCTSLRSHDARLR